MFSGYREGREQCGQGQPGRALLDKETNQASDLVQSWPEIKAAGVHREVTRRQESEGNRKRGRKQNLNYLNY